MSGRRWSPSRIVPPGSAAVLFLVIAGTAIGGGRAPDALEERSPAETPAGLTPFDPGGPDDTAELARIDTAAEAAEAVRLSPEAALQRLNSRNAHRGLSANEAKALLERKFASQFATLEQDPARVLSPEDVDRYLSATTARVDGAGTGSDSLVVSDTPLQDRDGSGHLAPVDLALEATGGVLRPENPLQELSLPIDLDRPAELGRDGLKVGFSPEGIAGPDASVLGGDMAYYYGIDTDTDLILAPTATGFRSFTQLRSVASPERLPLDVTAPGGADLSIGPEGELNISADGVPLGVISAPIAFDAQGAQVPVSLELVNGKVEIVISHRSADLAYPILVDPDYIAVDRDNGAWVWSATYGSAPGIDEWASQADDGRYERRSWCYTSIACYGSVSNRGLYIYARKDTTYPSGTYAAWTWALPDTNPATDTKSYISKFVLDPYWFKRNGDTGNNPYMMAGIHDWDTDSWVGKILYTTDRNLITQTVVPGTGGVAPATAQNGDHVTFGMASNTTRTLPEWRHIALGGALIEIKEPASDTPTLAAPPASQLPTGWISNGTYTVSATATDKGVGVKKVVLSRDGVAIQTKQETCTGSRSSPCPESNTAATNSFSIDVGALSDGVHTYSLQAFDLLDKPSPARSWEVMVDRDAPLVDLGGAAFSATQGELVSPESVAEVTAHDDGAGIASMTISVDSQAERSLDIGDIEFDGGTQSCGSNGCDLEYAFRLDVGEDVDAGAHTVSITLTDQLGHSQTETRELTLDTASPEVIAEGPLVDLQGAQLQGQPASLTATATEAPGGFESGLNRLAVEVDGAEVASETVVACAPQCGSELELSYTYEPADWSSGPHDVAVTAYDRAGNSSVKPTVVDALPFAEQQVACPAGEPIVEATVGELSATQAVQAVEADHPALLGETQPGIDSFSGAPIDPGVQESGEPGLIETEGSIVEGSLTGVGQLEVEVADTVCISPTTTTAAQTDGLIVAGDFALYANSAPQTDTIVRPTALGVVIAEQLRGAEAPTDSSWDVALPLGAELEQLESGDIAIVDHAAPSFDFGDVVDPPEEVPSATNVADAQLQYDAGEAALNSAHRATEGQVLGTFSYPSARDASGFPVEASLSIVGPSRVTLSVVPTPGIQFPVAATLAAFATPDAAAMCRKAFEPDISGYRSFCLRDPADEGQDVDNEDLSTADLDGPGDAADLAAGLDSASAQDLHGAMTSIESRQSATASSVPYPSGFSAEAIYFCLTDKHAPLCDKYLADANTAKRLATELFVNRLRPDDTKANAFQHSFWVAMMVNTAPDRPELASEFAIAYEGKEFNKVVQPNRLRRFKSRMDVVNDYIGHIFAKQYIDSDGNPLHNDEFMCFHMRKKVFNAKYIGRKRNPTNHAEPGRLIYRKKRHRYTKDDTSVASLIGTTFLVRLDKPVDCRSA